MPKHSISEHHFSEIDEKRFWQYVKPTALVLSTPPFGNCWEWVGTFTKGYGHFCYGDGRRVYAHRYVYQVKVGPIPNGLEIDHICRNRACVNPTHLELVTSRENTHRGYGVGGVRRVRNEKPVVVNISDVCTHICKYGHTIPPDRVRVNGRRGNCPTCSMLNSRKYRRQRREQNLVPLIYDDAIEYCAPV